MSTFNNIQNALNNRLSSVTNLPTVAWPNNAFAPVQATSYVRPTFLPARGDLNTLAGQGRHIGLYQVDVFVQLKKGTSPLLLIADSIRDHFNAQKSLTSGSDIIFIQATSISSPRRIESWWSCSVEIEYLCYS